MNAQNTHTLQLTDAQLVVISEGLMQVPFGRAAPVVDAINQQLDAERKQAETKPNVPDDALIQTSARKW